jgi:hypothetical protein
VIGRRRIHHEIYGCGYGARRAVRAQTLGLVVNRAAQIAMICALLPPQALAAQTAPSASAILDRMAANIHGLDSYAVPVHIDAKVRTGIASVPARMDGDRYFQAPDTSQLRLHSVPAVAKSFSNMYASLGTPVTWPKTYNITVQKDCASIPATMLCLGATYKRPANVDHILMGVDSTTYAPLKVLWFYKNGSTISMNIDETLVDGKYWLPQREVVDVSFPGYHGHATVTYGAYQINVPIPAN